MSMKRNKIVRLIAGLMAALLVFGEIPENVIRADAAQIMDNAGGSVMTDTDEFSAEPLDGDEISAEPLDGDNADAYDLADDDDFIYEDDAYDHSSDDTDGFGLAEEDEVSSEDSRMAGSITALGVDAHSVTITREDTDITAFKYKTIDADGNESSVMDSNPFTDDQVVISVDHGSTLMITGYTVEDSAKFVYCQYDRTTAQYVSAAAEGIPIISDAEMVLYTKRLELVNGDVKDYTNITGVNGYSWTTTDGNIYALNTGLKFEIACKSGHIWQKLNDADTVPVNPDITFISKGSTDPVAAGDGCNIEYRQSDNKIVCTLTKACVDRIAQNRASDTTPVTVTPHALSNYQVTIYRGDEFISRFEYKIKNGEELYKSVSPKTFVSGNYETVMVPEGMELVVTSCDTSDRSAFVYLRKSNGSSSYVCNDDSASLTVTSDTSLTLVSQKIEIMLLEQNSTTMAVYGDSTIEDEMTHRIYAVNDKDTSFGLTTNEGYVMTLDDPYAVYDTDHILDENNGLTGPKTNDRTRYITITKAAIERVAKANATMLQISPAATKILYAVSISADEELGENVKITYNVYSDADETVTPFKEVTTPIAVTAITGHKIDVPYQGHIVFTSISDSSKPAYPTTVDYCVGDDEYHFSKENNVWTVPKTFGVTSDSSVRLNFREFDYLVWQGTEEPSATEKGLMNIPDATYRVGFTGGVDTHNHYIVDEEGVGGDVQFVFNTNDLIESVTYSFGSVSDRTADLVKPNGASGGMYICTIPAADVNAAKSALQLITVSINKLNMYNVNLKVDDADASDSTKAKISVEYSINGVDFIAYDRDHDRSVNSFSVPTGTSIKVTVETRAPIKYGLADIKLGIHTSGDEIAYSTPAGITYTYNVIGDKQTATFTYTVRNDITVGVTTEDLPYFQYKLEGDSNTYDKTANSTADTEIVYVNYTTPITMHYMIDGVQQSFLTEYDIYLEEEDGSWTRLTYANTPNKYNIIHGDEDETVKTYKVLYMDFSTLPDRTIKIEVGGDASGLEKRFIIFKTSEIPDRDVIVRTTYGGTADSDKASFAVYTGEDEEHQTTPVTPVDGTISGVNYKIYKIKKDAYFTVKTTIGDPVRHAVAGVKIADNLIDLDDPSSLADLDDPTDFTYQAVASDEKLFVDVMIIDIDHLSHRIGATTPETKISGEISDDPALINVDYEQTDTLVRYYRNTATVNLTVADFDIYALDDADDEPDESNKIGDGTNGLPQLSDVVTIVDDPDDSSDGKALALSFIKLPSKTVRILFGDQAPSTLEDKEIYFKVSDVRMYNLNIRIDGLVTSTKAEVKVYSGENEITGASGRYSVVKDSTVTIKPNVLLPLQYELKDVRVGSTVDDDLTAAMLSNADDPSFDYTVSTNNITINITLGDLTYLSYNYPATADPVIIKGAEGTAPVDAVYTDTATVSYYSGPSQEVITDDYEISVSDDAGSTYTALTDTATATLPALEDIATLENNRKLRIRFRELNGFIVRIKIGGIAKDADEVPLRSAKYVYFDVSEAEKPTATILVNGEALSDDSKATYTVKEGTKTLSSDDSTYTVITGTELTITSEVRDAVKYVLKEVRTGATLSEEAVDSTLTPASFTYTVTTDVVIDIITEDLSNLKYTLDGTEGNVRGRYTATPLSVNYEAEGTAVWHCIGDTPQTINAYEVWVSSNMGNTWAKLNNTTSVPALDDVASLSEDAKTLAMTFTGCTNKYIKVVIDDNEIIFNVSSATFCTVIVLIDGEATSDKADVIVSQLLAASSGTQTETALTGTNGVYSIEKNESIKVKATIRDDSRFALDEYSKGGVVTPFADAKEDSFTHTVTESVTIDIRTKDLPNITYTYKGTATRLTGTTVDDDPIDIYFNKPVTDVSYYSGSTIRTITGDYEVSVLADGGEPVVLGASSAAGYPALDEVVTITDGNKLSLGFDFDSLSGQNVRLRIGGVSGTSVLEPQYLNFSISTKITDFTTLKVEPDDEGYGDDSVLTYTIYDADENDYAVSPTAGVSIGDLTETGISVPTGGYVIFGPTGGKDYLAISGFTVKSCEGAGEDTTVTDGVKVYNIHAETVVTVHFTVYGVNTGNANDFISLDKKSIAYNKNVWITEGVTLQDRYSGYYNYGRNFGFSLIDNKPYLKTDIVGVYYKVGNGTAVKLQSPTAAGPFTIPSEVLTAAINAGQKVTLVFDVVIPVYETNLKLAKGSGYSTKFYNNDPRTYEVIIPKWSSKTTPRNRTLSKVDLINSSGTVVATYPKRTQDPKWWDGAIAYNTNNYAISLTPGYIRTEGSGRNAVKYNLPAGQYKIKAYANQGTALDLTASMTITIRQGITGLDVTTPTHYVYKKNGKEQNFKAKAIYYGSTIQTNGEYGKEATPSTRKVTWYIGDPRKNEPDGSPAHLSSELSRYVSVNHSTGKVNVRADLKVDLNDNTFFVVAKAADFAGNTTYACSDLITIITDPIQVTQIRVARYKVDDAVDTVGMGLAKGYSYKMSEIFPLGDAVLGKKRRSSGQIIVMGKVVLNGITVEKNVTENFDINVTGAAISTDANGGMINKKPGKINVELIPRYGAKKTPDPIDFWFRTRYSNENAASNLKYTLYAGNNLVSPEGTRSGDSNYVNHYPSSQKFKLVVSGTDNCAIDTTLTIGKGGKQTSVRRYADRTEYFITPTGREISLIMYDVAANNQQYKITVTNSGVNTGKKYRISAKSKNAFGKSAKGTIYNKIDYRGVKTDKVDLTRYFKTYDDVKCNRVTYTVSGTGVYNGDIVEIYTSDKYMGEVLKYNGFKEVSVNAGNNTGLYATTLDASNRFVIDYITKDGGYLNIPKGNHVMTVSVGHGTLNNLSNKDKNDFVASAKEITLTVKAIAPPSGKATLNRKLDFTPNGGSKAKLKLTPSKVIGNSTCDMSGLGIQGAYPLRNVNKNGKINIFSNLYNVKTDATTKVSTLVYNGAAYTAKQAASNNLLTGYVPYAYQKANGQVVFKYAKVSIKAKKGLKPEKKQ